MSATTFAPSKALLEAFSLARQRPVCNCIQITRTKRRNVFHRYRSVSTATAQRSEMEVDKEQRPRWSHTPPAMAAPYPTKARPSGWQPFKCNSDPQTLDDVYSRVLGQNGPKMLSEETKWLAVTHKSFDHGRRGFNDRLAFLGKRIMELQMSLGLLTSVNASESLGETAVDPHGRQPFEHPAIANVESLMGNTKSYFMHPKRMAKIAEQYALPSVVRWQPKNPDNLSGSGCDMVYAQAVFAIVGALALEQGGAVANRIARERVIQTLGIRQGPEGRSESAEIS